LLLHDAERTTEDRRGFIEHDDFFIVSVGGVYYVVFVDVIQAHTILSGSVLEDDLDSQPNPFDSRWDSIKLRYNVGTNLKGTQDMAGNLRGVWILFRDFFVAKHGARFRRPLDVSHPHLCGRFPPLRCSSISRCATPSSSHPRDVDFAQ
jgi:hypothetical protein